MRSRQLAIRNQKKQALKQSKKRQKTRPASSPVYEFKLASGAIEVLMCLMLEQSTEEGQAEPEQALRILGRARKDKEFETWFMETWFMMEENQIHCSDQEFVCLAAKRAQELDEADEAKVL